MRKTIVIVSLTTFLFAISAPVATAALFWGRIGGFTTCICEGGVAFNVGRTPLFFRGGQVYARGRVAPGANALGRYTPGATCRIPIPKVGCVPVFFPIGKIVQIATS